jgi:ADP-heptose:LPS heptosyltransferase
MKILIINFGWIGDSILASSLAENCKLNGYEQVDLLLGFPQTAEILKLNSNIDNIYVSKIPGCDPVTDGIDLSIYDRVYKTAGLKFNKKPLDLFNEDFGFKDLKYSYELNTYEVSFEDTTKPILAFQLDWNNRSRSEIGPRNQDNIIAKLQKKYNIFIIGNNSHFSIDENTSETFLMDTSALKKCDLFFGYPGGLHWVAAGVGTKTICTSEHVFNHYKNNGEFKGEDFDQFKEQWQVHASKIFTDQKHILLEPFISDDAIVDYLMQL